jgi:uncharacterized membrane protein
MADLTGRMIGAAKADVKTLTEIEADPNAFNQAVIVILIAGVSALVGNIFRAGIVAGIIGLVGELVGYFLFAFLVFLIGTKLMPEPSTKSDFNETFRTVGFAASPGALNFLAIIPVLGVLISFAIHVWSLVIGVIAVREALDYSNTGRAIIVCLLAFVAIVIVYMVLLVPILGAMLISRM